MIHLGCEATLKQKSCDLLNQTCDPLQVLISTNHCNDLGIQLHSFRSHGDCWNFSQRSLLLFILTCHSPLCNRMPHLHLTRPVPLLLFMIQWPHHSISPLLLASWPLWAFPFFLRGWYFPWLPYRIPTLLVGSTVYRRWLAFRGGLFSCVA